jgi:hypothetical protein
MPETPTTTDTDPVPGRRPRGTQRVRVDQGSRNGSEIAPGRGSLLNAFGAWRGRLARPPVPVAEERRAESRHTEVECQAWVGWKTWRRFRLTNALVVNLSRGGAQVFLDAPPPADATVWVYLETPSKKAIVKGQVREVCSTSGGQCVVRLQFSEPCPFAFFEAAVCGLAASNPRARAPRVTAAGPR